MDPAATDPADSASKGYVQPELVEAADLLPADIGKAMPAVNPAAMAAKQEETPPAGTAAPAAAPPAGSKPAGAPAAAAPAGSAAAPTCSAGRTFDPIFHECTLDGKAVHSLDGLSSASIARLKPVLRSDGKTLKRRRTPLSALQETSHAANPETLDQPVQPAPGEAPAGQAQQPPQQPTDAEFRAAGATIAGMQLSVMRIALGAHVGEDEAERAALTDSWEATVRHYGWRTFHPLLVVGLVTVSIITTAAKHEETKTRLGQLKDWMRAKWTAAVYWWRHRRAPQAAP